MKHANPEMERVLIGMMLTSNAHVPYVLVDAGLRPRHLTDPLARQALDAIAALTERGDSADIFTVAEHIETGEAARQTAARLDHDFCAASVGAHITSTITMARQLVDLARWRARRDVLAQQDAACDSEDEQAFRAGEERLSAITVGRETRRVEPADQNDMLFQELSGDKPSRLWSTPWPALTFMLRGGLEESQSTFLSGVTRFGKSVVADQLLEAAAATGARARLYMNEMSGRERRRRVAARNTGIPMSRLMRLPLSEPDSRRTLKWLNDTGVRMAIEECDGWSMADICRDVKRRGCDVFVVDLLDNLPLLDGMSRRETTEESMRLIKQTVGETGAHAIVLGHLNRSRQTGSARVPEPALGDIRESGMIANLAHNVLFVHREQDELGKPLEDGLIIVAKHRNGDGGAVRVTFDGDRQRFLELDEHHGDSGRFERPGVAA